MWRQEATFAQKNSILCFSVVSRYYFHIAIRHGVLSISSHAYWKIVRPTRVSEAYPQDDLKLSA